MREFKEDMNLPKISVEGPIYSGITIALVIFIHHTLYLSVKNSKETFICPTRKFSSLLLSAIENHSNPVKAIPN